ncbi:TonB-dependent receptor plug domain-containing protein, partial [Noviherbaspirillum sp. ST9]|uniref:TonB-dependent receptor plug domain-containing protein n=1 Tax=Noviherbaspirillum sp. ST9 TaxID=3401606 RepID=UPI003B589599
MQQVIAQNTITITGRVISSEDRASLPGVSVTLKGSSAAAQSNINDDYTIKVPNSNSVLVFTYMGLVSQEKEVSSSRVVNVTLRPQNNDLNEVVIIGYGQSSRKDLTGSVGSVKMGEVGKAPVRSFEEALAGRVAGVSASSDDGQPGASVNIVIRGNNSLTQDNSPLYVIDGFPIENPDNNALNPAEIESIEVRKD